MKESFLGKPQRALCIILVLCTAAFYIVMVRDNNNPAAVNRSAINETFIITQRFYGVDAAEMERVAAIPLEDALSGIRGLKRILSSSENSRARIVCYFEGKEPGRYEAVREAAQRVYESLPKAAQRPEISSSGDSRVPVWTAALINGKEKSEPENIGTLLEKIVKPALEKLPGAGNVEISGAGPKETVITLKSEEAATRKIDASDIAAVLAQNDILLPGGSIKYYGDNTLPDTEITIMVDGRIEDLRKALISIRNSAGNADYVQLEDLAIIVEQERDYESRSRLNGKETVLVAVMGSGETELAKLSRQINEELLQFPDLEFIVLSDRGEAERQAHSSALGAAFQGACMVAFLCVLLCFRKRKFALVCVLTVPLAFFFSTALLILFGFSPDKLVLAGLSAGVGAAVDTSLLSAEYFRSCRTIEEGKNALKTMRFPLVSGVLTTVIALLPLMAQKNSGMHSVAWALASVNMVSMVLALTLLPPIFLWNCEDSLNRKKNVEVKRKSNYAKILFLKLNHIISAFIFTAITPLLRFWRRKLASMICLVLNKPLLVVCCWLLLSILGIAALCLNGADVGEESPEDSVYAQIEFESGLHIEETDRALALYGSELKKREGIKNVQTVARTGTGSALVSFDPQITNNETVRELIRNTSPSGAFVYIVESSGKEKSWRIKIAGDEGSHCRELAAEAARRCSSLDLVSEAVLNFKEGSPRINLIPDRERIALNAFSFGGIGHTIRRGIHGPVAYKRINNGGETDVRIKGNSSILNREEVLQILIKGENSPLELGRLAMIENAKETGSIQREDRRRSASITIRTPAMDPRKIRDRVMPLLSTMELPPGYTIEFDPEALKAAKAVGAQSYRFILALLFCYMIIAALKESFSFPLALLAVVPPSLSAPAFYLVLLGYPINAISAAAFVAVSGLAINAAALTADALENAEPNAATCYRIYRRRLPLLAATTITTVAAALPFLFIKSNAVLMVKTLAIVSALGIAVSAPCAITLIPAMVKLFPGLLGKIKNKQKHQIS